MKPKEIIAVSLDHSWWRLQVPFNELKKKGHNASIYHHLVYYNSTIKPPDVIVLHAIADVTILEQVKKWKQAGSRVIYDMDDNIYVDEKFKDCINNFNELADVITVSTIALQELVYNNNKKLGIKKDIFILPNCIPDKYLTEKKHITNNTFFLPMGHAYHWDNAKDSFDELYKSIIIPHRLEGEITKIDVIGMADTSKMDRLNFKFISVFMFETQEYMDFLQDSQYEGIIRLMSADKKLGNFYKSPIKLFEAAIAGADLILNDIGYEVYKSITGLTAEKQNSLFNVSCETCYDYMKGFLIKDRIQKWIEAYGL